MALVWPAADGGDLFHRQTWHPCLCLFHPLVVGDGAGGRECLAGRSATLWPAHPAPAVRAGDGALGITLWQLCLPTLCQKRPRSFVYLGRESTGGLLDEFHDANL